MLEKLDLKSKIFLFVLAGLVANAIISRLINPPMPSLEPAKEKPHEQVSPGASPIYYELRAKRDVRARLRDPDSAEFSNVTTRGRIVCGYVNSRNGFGGMSGRQRFISGGGAVTGLEEDMSAAEMEKLWRLC